MHIWYKFTFDVISTEFDPVQRQEGDKNSTKVRNSFHEHSGVPDPATEVRLR